jgi:hypothetical protein
MIVLGGWATGTGQYVRRMLIFIHSVNLQDHYTIQHQLPRQKQNRVQWWALSVGISASGNEKNASTLGRTTRDVTNVGGSGGRSGDQFRCVALGEFRSGVGGEGKPVVEQGRRNLLRYRRGSWQPKQRDGP